MSLPGRRCTRPQVIESEEMEEEEEEEQEPAERESWFTVALHGQLMIGRARWGRGCFGNGGGFAPPTD